DREWTKKKNVRDGGTSIFNIKSINLNLNFMNNKFLQVRRTVKYLSIGVILQCFFYSYSAASNVAEELDSERFLNNLSVANVSLEESGKRLSAADASEADILVSGTITDDLGEPLPGVN